MHDLQVLQNKAAKVILDLPNYASSTDALKTLGWPTLFQERLVHRYITTFKVARLDFFRGIPPKFEP